MQVRRPKHREAAADEVEKLIRAIQDFGEVSQELKQEIHKNTLGYDFRKGYRVSAKGYKYHSVFFITKGLVRLYYKDEDSSKERIKTFCSEGELCGDLLALRKGVDSDLFIDCIEPTSGLEFRWEYAHNNIVSDAKWQAIMSGFILSLSEKKIGREESLLTESAEARFHSFLNRFQAIAHRIPQKHVASYVGITPVALSRIRAQRKKA